MPHKPVLLKEVLEGLEIRPGAVVVDGTLGSGGHAEAIVKQIGAQGRFIAIDQDPAALERCRKLFQDHPQLSFCHENFRNIDKVLDSLNIRVVDAVILDVGFSSDQIEEDRRGFSFERSGPLDMRMNPQGSIQARDLIRDLSQPELEKVFREYGEIRGARWLAEVICEERKKRPIETTRDLVDAVERAWPPKTPSSKSKKGSRPPWARRHPATRVFQALRIAVNDELNALEEGLEKGWQRLKAGGRIAVISFHSLEDRIVKNHFRQWYRNHEARLVTKKPVTPSREEIKDNPRSRSAKLRIAEKINEGNG